MKRLHIINLEKMGGAEKIFLQYIKNKNSSSDIIFCISNFIANEIQQELGNTPLVFANRIFNNIPIKYPSAIRKLVLQRKIEYKKADVVIFWDFVPHLFRKIKHSKVVYYDHGASWRLPENKKVLTFFQQVNTCISVSHASKRIMQERFNLSVPIKVIRNTLPQPNVFDFDRVFPTQNKVTLGTASRLVSLKCIGVSILTIAGLRNRGYNAKLLIAGKGPNEIPLRKLVDRLKLQEHVTFLGFRENLSEFYQSIDFYMSTSISESFGLSCMDALYHGVPCVYSMIDGQAEVIKNGVTGFGITPSILPEEYSKTVGYHVEKPYFSYDPLSDNLTQPKVVNAQDCISCIERVITTNSYCTYISNINKYISNIKKENEVSENINVFLNGMNSRND